jgi:Secretion system C-terminal sorting domain
MTKILLFLCLFFTSFSLSAQKTWTGAMDATWANAGNWMPMGVPSSTDEVLFNNAMSNTVSLAAATSVGQIKVSNNSTLILKSSVTASLDLTITGATGDDLVVAAGSSLNITSASNVVAQQIIQIIIPTTVTASISGNMAFSNTGTASIDHRLLATDVGSVVFQSGSVFTADLGFGGIGVSPFISVNTSGAYNIYRFASGSRYISRSGGPPSSNAVVNSHVIFDYGSTYQHDQTTRPQLSGRKYPNFEYTKTVVNSTSNNSFIIEGNLTIKNGGGGILNISAQPIDYYSTVRPFEVQGDLIIESGGSLTLGTFSSTALVVRRNIIVKNGGTLTIGTGTSNNIIALGGDLLVESGGSLILGTGTNNLYLRGNSIDAVQTITNYSTTSSGIFSKLLLNSWEGVKLASNLEVQNLEFFVHVSLTYAESLPCRIHLGNYDLKVNGDITGLINKKRHVVTDGTGRLIRPNVGTTPVLFPVSIGGDGDFVTLTNTGTPDEFSVNVNTYASFNPSFNLTNPNIWNRVWNISEGVAGGSNVTMTIRPQDEGSFFVPGTVVLGHGNPNGTFNALPAVYVPDPPFGGILTANNVTTFSPFIIANDVALGVTLTNFTAHLTNKNTVLLNWQTENEKDNSGFEIQRSSDAEDWSNIGFVKGKGQSSVAFDYTFEDKGPLSPAGLRDVTALHILTYYRLKQVDFDGKATYSKVINVLAKKNNNQFIVFPNPTKGKTTTLELNEDLVDGTLTVTNAVGSIVKKQTVNSKTLTLDLSTLTNGVYIFDIQKGANRYFEKVMVAE